MTSNEQAYLAIQCTFPGETRRGTFLYAGATSYRDPAARLVSPMRADCLAFYAWANDNGWRPLPFDPAHPCGVFAKTSTNAVLQSI